MNFSASAFLSVPFTRAICSMASGTPTEGITVSALTLKDFSRSAMIEDGIWPMSISPEAMRAKRSVLATAGLPFWKYCSTCFQPSSEMPRSPESSL